MRRSVWLFGLAFALIAPSGLAAQNSIFGVRGIGFPSREVSARARALGGGFAIFDPLSPLNPASAFEVPTLTGMVTSSTESRSYDVGTASASGLHQTRFPLVGLVGPAGSLPIGLRVTGGTYAERSYDLETTDTLMLRGVPVGVDDHISSKGAVADIAGAVAWRLGSHLVIGGGLHALTGSTQLKVSRDFADSSYRAYALSGVESFRGVGVDGGVLVTIARGFQLAASARLNGDLNVRIDSVQSGSVLLPASVAGGLLLAPRPALRWVTTVQWQSWSRAAPGLANGSAFDTWQIGSGIELGAPESGKSKVPLRIGFRYATLPFSPTADQPHEYSVALGSGLIFARNRATIDATIERVKRSGAGVSESAWEFTFGMMVRPSLLQ